jgi:hypothetical protein
VVAHFRRHFCQSRRTDHNLEVEVRALAATAAQGVRKPLEVEVMVLDCTQRKSECTATDIETASSQLTGPWGIRNLRGNIL